MRRSNSVPPPVPASDLCFPRFAAGVCRSKSVRGPDDGVGPTVDEARRAIRSARNPPVVPAFAGSPRSCAHSSSRFRLAAWLRSSTRRRPTSSLAVRRAATPRPPADPAIAHRCAPPCNQISSSGHCRSARRRGRTPSARATGRGELFVLRLDLCPVLGPPASPLTLSLSSPSQGIKTATVSSPKIIGRALSFAKPGEPLDLVRFCSLERWRRRVFHAPCSPPPPPPHYSCSSSDSSAVVKKCFNLTRTPHTRARRAPAARPAARGPPCGAGSCRTCGGSWRNKSCISAARGRWPAWQS